MRHDVKLHEAKRLKEEEKDLSVRRSISPNLFIMKHETVIRDINESLRMLKLTKASSSRTMLPRGIVTPRPRKRHWEGTLVNTTPKKLELETHDARDDYARHEVLSKDKLESVWKDNATRELFLLTALEHCLIILREDRREDLWQDIAGKFMRTLGKEQDLTLEKGRSALMEMEESEEMIPERLYEVF